MLVPHIKNYRGRPSKKIVLGLCMMFLLLESVGRGSRLEVDELNAILDGVNLPNTVFMYSTREGDNYAYSIGKGGRVTPLDASFCATARFGLGSNTKMLTALLAIQMVEQGKLKLDDSLDTIAHRVVEADKKRNMQFVPPPPPSFSPIEVHPDFSSISLRNLLTHHAGFPGVDTVDFNYPADFSRDALMRWIFKMGPGPVDYRQDVKDAAFCFHYSNEGYSVLGEILERLSDPHQSYETLLKKRLFAPLGIKSGHLITKKEALQHLGKKRAHLLLPVELGPAMAPSAGAVCTLDDWMVLLRHLMNGVNGGPLSSASLLREPGSFQTLIKPEENCFYGAGGLMISKDPPAAYHFGSNSIHSSLAWFELSPHPKSAGFSCIVVSTEPFHDVSSLFYLLAQSIQEKLTSKRSAEETTALPPVPPLR